MERNLARQTIRANWQQIIKKYTGTAQRKVAGQETYICPFCGHGTHGDGITTNPKSTDGHSLKCFGCGFSGDIIDLIQQYDKLDYDTALKQAAADLGITVDPYRPSAAADFTESAQEAPHSDYKPAADKETQAQPKAPGNGTEGATPADYSRYYKECAERLTDPAARAYLQARGISMATAQEYGIGFDPKADPASAPGATGDTYRPHPAPRLILPVTPSFYIGRRTDGGSQYKKMNSKGGGTGIFNAGALYQGDPIVFVTEGLIDALSIIEAGAAAVALNSVNNADMFLQQIRRKRPTAQMLVICLDQDEAGKRATDEKIKPGLTAQNIAFMAADISGNYKDPNEALTKDPKTFKKAVQEAKQAAADELNKDDLTRFFEKVQTTAYRPYQTGLGFLDKLLDGGIIMQTVTLLMAAPGAGKTTLCQQIAEEMARRKKSVIYLNLEMSKEQMIAKTLSARISAAGKRHYTVKDILQGYRWSAEDRETIQAALEDYRKNVFPFIKYNPDGIGSDLDTILQYIDDQGTKAKAAGEQAPAVVLDYLHLITNGRGLDVQELIKQTMAGIKNYCVKYDTFAIVISAVNRDAIKRGALEMGSGRDSSNIEYGCDTELALNYKAIHKGEKNPETSKDYTLAELQQQPRREMVLQVLKSRFTQPGREAYCIFHAATNRFYDMTDYTPAAEGETPFTEPETPADKPAPRRRG